MRSVDVTFPASGNVTLEPGRPTPAEPTPALPAAMPDARGFELAIVCWPTDEVMAARVELLTMAAKALEKFSGMMMRASIPRLFKRSFASSSLTFLR